MTQFLHRAATYADIEALPPNIVGEILFGVLETHPRPAPRHAVAANALADEITGPYQKSRGGPGGWVFMVEPELHLGPHVAVPDIAGWRRETLPFLPDTAWIETAPDWVCEVLSRSTETNDRGPKRRIYADAGVSYVWLLDPRLRLLEAFGLAGGNWVHLATLRDDEEVRVAPFDAISFPLGVLWPFDMPADGAVSPTKQGIE